MRKWLRGPQGWNGAAYVSYRRLVFAVATTWAAAFGAGISLAAEHVARGVGYVIALPLELALVATAGLLANRYMRKENERRRDSLEPIDLEERIDEELEQTWARLEKLRLSPERLLEEKLLALRRAEARRDAIRKIPAQSFAQELSTLHLPVDEREKERLLLPGEQQVDQE